MEKETDLYRHLFDANPRPMYVSDRATLQILSVNHAACELYGWSRDELLTMTLRDIRPPEEVAFFEAALADSAKSGATTYRRFGRHHSKDGRVLEVAIEITRVMFGDRPASLAVITDLTDIGEAERRFKLLVENSSDGISLTSPTGILEYISPGGRRILGYSDEELVGQRAGLVTHPDDRATWSAPGPGETKHHVSRMRRHDGTWRWIESSTTNLAHDPAVRAFVSNYRDITERVVSESALRDSQQRLEFLLSATSAVTYTATPTYRTTFMGANLKQVLGYDPEEFYAGPSFWLANIHPDDRPMVDAFLAQQLPQTGAAPALQYRFRHKDGAYRWMRDVVRVLRDDAGAIIEFVGYWVDVTDQVRAEEAVRRSEESFRTLIERAPIATFVHNEGRYIYVNPAAVVLLGHQRADEIIGRPVLDYVHPDDRADLARKMAELASTGTAAFSGLRMVRADGSMFVLEGEALLLPFDGAPSHVVMGHDVTERDAVFARIAMADRMLSIGTLAAGVAHEINNPLAYIATNLELLAAELPNIRPSSRSRLTDATLQCLVTDARDGVSRVNAIVRDLRSLSRPDDTRSGAVDVVDVLASSIKMANNEIRHRARVVQVYDDNLPTVDADASRLGQVFVNLLLNAAQAIVEGQADRNEIRVRATTAEDGRVRIDISDTGAGIPQTIIGRIFDPFFTTKAPGAGTGLGLAISHQIVLSLGGEITVESHPGTGSTFSVVLPVAARAATSAPRMPPASVGFSRRILLVDDEAAVGRSLQMLLAPETEVVAVLSAEDALATLAGDERFDAIVCDLMMPQSSGIQLYEQLASVAPDCVSRIIFMTGGAFTPQAREFLARLDRPHLEKPFSEQELRDAIARVTR